MANIKNIIFMSAALCLALGFIIAGASEDNMTDDSLSSASETAATTTITAAPVTEVSSQVALSGGIPEMTCSQISFKDGSMLIADSSGGYTLINPLHEQINALNIFDDDGNSVLIICSEDSIELRCADENIDSFVYDGHLIEYTDGKFYYDKSEVLYVDTAFSSYQLSDEYTLECTAASKYILRKADGTTSNMATVTDDLGQELEIEVGRTGFSATNPENLLEPTIKINGDLINISGATVYINGQELVPPGFNDINVIVRQQTTTTTTTSAATTTKKESAEESSEKTVSSAQTQAPVTTPATTTPQAQTSQTAAKTTTKAATTTTKTTTTKATTTAKTTTKATTTKTQTSSSSSGVSDLTTEMLGYVNEVRRQYGLSELSGLKTLDSVAKTRVSELLTEYSHDRPNGTSFSTAVDEAGLYWFHVAENIANGVNCMSTAREAFDAWMNSEGHRANILNPKMKYMAVAKKTITIDGQTKTYWEQIFFNDEYVPD